MRYVITCSSNWLTTCICTLAWAALRSSNLCSSSICLSNPIIWIIIYNHLVCILVECWDSFAWCVTPRPFADAVTVERVALSLAVHLGLAIGSLGKGRHQQTWKEVKFVSTYDFLEIFQNWWENWRYIVGEKISDEQHQQQKKGEKQHAWNGRIKADDMKRGKQV